MDSALIVILIVLVGLLCVLVVAVLLLQLRKSNSNDVATPLQNLNQSIQDVRVQTASLQNLNQIVQDIRVQTASMDADSKARVVVERQTAESISRLETIIVGSSSKGEAGERVLENIIAKLPSEWQIQNFRIGNKFVEFGLKLSNGLILPIDSKWAATNLLEQFSASVDLDEQKKLRDQVEKIVINKAKEVQKYIEPNITTSFGVAVIPDAVYDICPTVNLETRKNNVVVVSYSMFLPYLLLVFDTVLRTSRALDTEKLNANIQVIQKSIADIEKEIEGRYSKAMNMFEYLRHDLKGYIGKVNNALASIHMTSDQSATESPENSDNN